MLCRIHNTIEWFKNNFKQNKINNIWKLKFYSYIIKFIYKLIKKLKQLKKFLKHLKKIKTKF